MQSANAIHELLPWFVSGKLGDREAAEFREHLSACEACRQEMSFLEQVRQSAGRHGQALFAEHPSSEQLVAHARDELSGEDRAAVARHLELCAACTTEAGWVRGDAVAGDAGQATGSVTRFPEPPGPRPWLWAGAGLAAGLLLATLSLPLWQSPTSYTGLSRSTLVAPVERSGGGVTRIELQPDQRLVELEFEADFDASAFPLRLEVVRADGTQLELIEGIRAAQLAGGLYLGWNCDRSECTAGKYTARLFLSGQSEPELLYPFEVVTR